MVLTQEQREDVIANSLSEHFYFLTDDNPLPPGLFQSMARKVLIGLDKATEDDIRHTEKESRNR